MGGNMLATAHAITGGATAGNLFARHSKNEGAMGGDMQAMAHAPTSVALASNLSARYSGNERGMMGGNGFGASLGSPLFAATSITMGRGSRPGLFRASGCDPGSQPLTGALPFAGNVFSRSSNGGGDYSCFSTAPAAASGAARLSSSSLTAGMFSAGGGGPGVMVGSWLDGNRETNINVASLAHPVKSDASMGTSIGEELAASIMRQAQEAAVASEYQSSIQGGSFQVGQSLADSRHGPAVGGIGDFTPFRQNSLNSSGSG